MNEQYVLEADPKKPYKMYAGMIAAFLGSLMTAGILPPWGTAVVAGIIAALAIYATPNPLKVKPGRRSGEINDDPALW